MNFFNWRHLASALLACVASAALAQDKPPVEWEKEYDPGRLVGLIMENQGSGNFEQMQQAAHRLVRLRPYVGAYGYLLAKSYALADKKSEAYNVLLMLNNQGLSFDLDQDQDLANIRDYEVFKFLQDGYAKNAEPLGAPLNELTLGRSGLLTDGMAWDPKRRQYLVGSITEGSVFVVGPQGQLEPLVAADENNGLLAVFDIAVDHQRRALWMTSASVPHFRNIRYQDVGRTAVVEADLDSGEIRNRYDLPGVDRANKLVNLTVAPDGSVFVANSGKPEVYRIDVEKKTMSRIFQAPSFTSLRGLAVSPDGKTLYFSDYELGLFAVDLADNKAYQVTGGPQFNLGGIDGLSWFEDGLIAVQNGNFPNRVYRIVLDGSGRSVANAGPLLVNHPLFVAPGEGIVANGRFHVLARNNAASYDPRSGKLLAGAKLLPQVIVSVDTAILAPIDRAATVSR